MDVKTKIFFYRVKTNPAKLMTICHKVKEAFMSDQRILIAVPSADAAAYIDQLLWRMPEESFIPHLIAANPTADRVVIAINPTKNLNKAQVLLNLSSTISPISKEFSLIHELFDETDGAKAMLSNQRQNDYRQMGCQCDIIES